MEKIYADKRQVNLAHWHLLVKRYFDAETTEDEERELKRFLVTSAASDADFQEARAVMGLIACGRKSRLRTPRVIPFTSLYRVASVVIVLFLGVYAFQKLSGNGSDVCVAYVNGHKITDEDKVMELFNDDIRRVDIHAEDDNLESQMKQMFDSVDQND